MRLNFHKYLKESCFLDCWKVSCAAPVFKNTGDRSTGKNYSLFILLSVGCKDFENLVKSSLADHLNRCDLFPDFKLWFQVFSFDYRSSDNCI